jgi:hypothetical protein
LNGVTSAVKEPRNLVLAVMAVLDSVFAATRRVPGRSRYQQNIGSAWSMKEPQVGNLNLIHPIDDRALL